MTLGLEQFEDFMAFLDEIPTNKCGEGGCGPCDLAFHRSCDVLLLPTKPSDGVPTAEFEAEEDTQLDIVPTFQGAFFEEQEYHELGGEG